LLISVPSPSWPYELLKILRITFKQFSFRELTRAVLVEDYIIDDINPREDAMEDCP
jgi:hypothetical protein